MPGPSDRSPDADPSPRPSAAGEAEGAEPGTPAAPSSAPGRRVTSAIGERAVANTFYRSGGEVIGRLASLVLFAECGRILGPNGLGAFVFAIAFLSLLSVGVDLGLDRYLLRAIARERSSSHDLFFNVLALKVAVAVPLFGLGFVALDLLGYSATVQHTTWALAPGVFFDSVARTQLSVFMGHERGGPPSAADSIERILSAAMGVAALRVGWGVVGVAGAYSLGSILGVLLGFALLARAIGMPARAVSYRRWRGIVIVSLPFATQDTFNMALARVGTVILSLMATQAAVGRYGAAYRLFESTLLVAYAIAGAFAAMFTYLAVDSARAAFERSVKFALVLLAPIAVAFGVLAEPICKLIYGHQFGAAGVPLRILAPAVVLIGLVTLANSLLISREKPGPIVKLTAGIAALNIALSLILIPAYSDAGAAAAVLVTEVVYAGLILRMTRRSLGAIHWLATATGTVAAGVAMSAVSLALHDSLWAALILGSIVYMVTLLAVERIVSPVDVKLMTAMVRRRLPSRTPG